MHYLRAYPTDLPVLRDLLPEIQTPVQIINGARDPVVPLVNAEYLHERLPMSKLDLLDAGHFAWEDRADEYAALITSWWATATRPSDAEETKMDELLSRAYSALAGPCPATRLAADRAPAHTGTVAHPQGI